MIKWMVDKETEKCELYSPLQIVAAINFSQVYAWLLDKMEHGQNGFERQGLLWWSTAACAALFRLNYNGFPCLFHAVTICQVKLVGCMGNVEAMHGQDGACDLHATTTYLRPDSGRKLALYKSFTYLLIYFLYFTYIIVIVICIIVSLRGVATAPPYTPIGGGLASKGPREQQKFLGVTK